MDMDPFTARMLERARARREKLDKKLCGVAGDPATRAPLAENVVLPQKTEAQSTKTASPSSSAKPKAVPGRKSGGSSSKAAEASPRKSANGTPVKKRTSASPRKSTSASKTPKTRVLQPVESETSTTSTASDSKPVIVGDVTKDSATFEINILNNCDDMILNIQVEEKEVNLSEYLKQKREDKNVIRTFPNSNVTVITSSPNKENKRGGTVVTSSKDDTKADIRDGVKSRLQRLGVLYSDKETLSSPIHRTEEKFNAASPKQSPSKGQTDGASKVKKYGRLAALADQINNWEDDVTHHQYGAKGESTDVPPTKKLPAAVTQSPTKSKQVSSAAIHQPKSPVTKPSVKPALSKPSPSKLQGNRPTGMLDKRLVDALEGAGYRLSTGRSRLVYDFGMAPVALDTPQPQPQPALVKRPSLKKYKAPLPPNQAPPPQPPTPPIVDQPNHQVKNVLAKAAMFEGSSPRQRDPAEMSLRERKALFEKNNAIALVPKAPFGQAPSAKQLNSAAAAANKAGSTCRVTGNSAPPKPTTAPPPPPKQASSASPAGNSGAGIRGKLAALFTTTTISGKEIADKAKNERDKEMNMLLNRFQHDRGAANGSPGRHPNGEDDSSEKSPLIGDRVEETPLHMHRKPEIVSNIPKLHDSSSNSEPNKPAVPRSPDSDSSDSVIGQQPSKRRSSQSSSAKVSAVLDDVKRIRVSGESNGALPDGRIYPHLSDIETATSSAPEESSECGGSSLDISSEECTASLQQKSSEWGNTSFGRDLLAVVQNKRLDNAKKGTTQTKVNTHDSDDNTSEENTLDSDMDNILDDAFDDVVEEDCNEDDDGPTASKINKNNVPVPSDSFSYSHGAVKRLREEEKGTFKSPLKASAATPSKNGSLYHSVSVYRKKQNEELKPTVQVRTPNQQIVTSPDKSGPEKQSRQQMEALIKEKISKLSGEVNKQQTIISQASQALNLCAATVEFNQSTEQAEGERLLLLATHRRHALLNEIQRLKVEGDPHHDESTVTVTISNITVPLRRDYIRKLNADGVVGHHVVALVKCGVRVIATTMRTTAHNNYTVAFPEVIELDELPPDFKVTIEIYLLQASPESLPHDVKYHIVKKSSKLLTPKSKCSSSELRTPKIQSPCGPNAVRSTQFHLHGYSIFAVEQVKRTSFSLSKVPSGSPLEGALGVNVTLVKARPPAPAPHSAFLTIFRSVSGLGAWNRRWARLHEHHLNFWTYPDDEKTKIPTMTIDLSECVNDQVIIAPRDICARTNTILFDTKVPQGCPVDPNSLTIIYNENGEPRMRYLLAADTKEERQEWLNLLNAALEYSRSVNE